MSDLNIRFSNCFDFINNTKQYLEANPTDWRNIYTEEALVRAECDLMEMELEALYDTEEYDALLKGNAFRTSKRAQRRKANKKHHVSDRKHGKDRYKTIKKMSNIDIIDLEIPSCKKFFDTTDEMNGSWVIMNRNKKVGRRAETLQKVTYNRKTFRNRLNSAMTAREEEYMSEI